MEEYPWEELLEENSEVSFVNDAYEGCNSAYKNIQMKCNYSINTTHSTMKN
jgi:hypothetical protein